MWFRVCEKSRSLDLNTAERGRGKDSQQMTDTTPTAEQEAPLTSMKVADLQALAAGLQIRGARSLRKGALIEAIEAARASAEPEAPSAEPAAPAEQAEPEAQDAPAEAPATPEASENITVSFADKTIS